MIMINGCFPAFLFCISRKRGANRSITFFAYAFGINKQYIHLLKLFAILVFFKYQHSLHIYILYTKKIGGCSSFADSYYLLFFSVSLFCQKIFSWEMKFFLLLLNALQLSTFYVNSSHMNSHKMENGNKKCQRTESQKRCNLENYVHV